MLWAPGHMLRGRDVNDMLIVCFMNCKFLINRSFIKGLIDLNTIPGLCKIHICNITLVFLSQALGHVPQSGPADKGEAQTVVWGREGAHCDDAALFGHRGGAAGRTVWRRPEPLWTQEPKGTESSLENSSVRILCGVEAVVSSRVHRRHWWLVVNNFPFCRAYIPSVWYIYHFSQNGFQFCIQLWVMQVGESRRKAGIFPVKKKWNLCHWFLFHFSSFVPFWVMFNCCQMFSPGRSLCSLIQRDWTQNWAFIVFV